MATPKNDQKAKTTRRTTSAKREFDINKYLQDAHIGDLSLDDVLEGSSKNVQAIAAANKAIVDGYIDVTKRQYEMLKELLNEARAISGPKSKAVKQLKQLVKLAKQDLQDLLKMAKKTNSEAQKILQKRTSANIKAWKKLISDTKKRMSDRKQASKTKAKSKASAAKKTPAKKTPAKKTTAKKPAAKKATAKKASKAKAAPRKARAAGVTQAAVLEAIGAGHSTPKDIAAAMNANPVQVNKALSRYTQQGIIVRTRPGQYALK